MEWNDDSEDRQHLSLVEARLLITQLRKLGPPPVPSTLLSSVRTQLGLGKEDFSSPLSFEGLTRDLYDDRWPVRMAAVRKLSQFGISAAVELIGIALHDENKFVRAAALQAFEVLNVGENGGLVETIIDALHDEQGIVRAAAAKTLGALGRPDSTRILEKILSDEDENVHTAAINALEALKGQKSRQEHASKRLKDGGNKSRRQTTQKNQKRRIPSERRSSMGALPRLLASLPYAIRLCIAVLCLMFCLALFMLLFRISTNPIILAVPTALAAWMFKRRGTLLCVVAIIVTQLIFLATMYTKILLDPRIVLSIIVMIPALLVLGLFISSQRAWFDRFRADHLHELQINEQQQQLNQLKDQFILNVNHELRTPLTVMYGYLELLREQQGALDQVTQAKYLDGAIQACETLNLLVNRILDASDIGARVQSIQAEEISVVKVARDILERFSDQKHRLRLDISETLTVWADQSSLRQILRNLLSNACKYSPPDTMITVSAVLYQDPTQETKKTPIVRICVQDAGPGIPPEEVSTLFDKFQRLRRDIAGPVRGSGLGLFLCRQLVEAMDGRIWVESSGIPGEGSRFYFTLPPAPHAAVERELHKVSQYKMPAPLPLVTVYAALPSIEVTHVFEGGKHLSPDYELISARLSLSRCGLHDDNTIYSVPFCHPSDNHVVAVLSGPASLCNR